MIGPALAALVAALATRLALTTPWPDFAVAALMAVPVAWIAWRDVASFTIPDLALGAMAGTAAVLRWQGWGEGEVLALGADLLLSAGLLWLVREAFYRRRGVDALGFGDVKLAAMMGLWLGAGDFAMALLAASGTGLALAGAAALAGRPVTLSTKIPFGALLAPAGYVVWRLAGPAIGSAGSA